MSLKFSRLTRSGVRALSAGASIREHGIIADKMADGDVRYSVNVMVNRQRIHRVIGCQSEGVTREQAERAIESFRTRAREDRLDLPQGRKAHRTFAEAAKEYIARLEQSGGKNLKPKKMHLGRHLVPYFGRQRADQIQEFDLRTYRATRLKVGASDATINREMATLSHLLRSGVRWRWFAANAMPLIEKEREARQPITVLTDEQAAALMDAARNDQDERLWLFVLFGLSTAMRHREILNVRYDQIDLHARRIFIPEAKAGQREQPITLALAEALIYQREQEAGEEWVFPSALPSQSKAGHRTSMARPFARAVVRAQLNATKVTPHTMRRTAITRLVKAGVDLPSIQRISGHKTLAMVLRYVNVHGSHIDSAMATLDGNFSGAVTPQLHTAANSGWMAERRSGATSPRKTKPYSMEARPGIEPGCEDLQSSTSPLRHRAAHGGALLAAAGTSASDGGPRPALARG